LKTFIESVFKRFDTENKGQVNFDNFKQVYQREPHLLEIFDYFNKGIVDSIGPVQELDEREKHMLEELEGLHEKINKIKNYLYGVTDNIESLHQLKDATPNSRHSQFMRSLTRQSRGQLLQHLDTNIRRTIFFEPLREESGKGKHFLFDLLDLCPPHLSLGKDRPHSVNIGQIEYPKNQNLRFTRLSTANAMFMRGNQGLETPIANPHPESFLNTLDEMMGKSQNSINTDGGISKRYYLGSLDKTHYENPNNQAQIFDDRSDNTPHKDENSIELKGDVEDPILRNVVRRKTDIPLKKSNSAVSFYGLRRSKSKFYKKSPGKLETRPDAFKLAPKNIEEPEVRLSLATKEYAMRIEETDEEYADDKFDYPEERRELSLSPDSKTKHLNQYRHDEVTLGRGKENIFDFGSNTPPLRGLRNSEVVIELPNQLSPVKDSQRLELYKINNNTQSRNSIQKPAINLSMADNTPLAGGTGGAGTLRMPYLSPRGIWSAEMKPQDILERINHAAKELDKVASTALALADELKNKNRKHKSEEKE